MYEFIVADDQELYRAGVVGLLSNGIECHTISQFSDWVRLLTAVETNRESLVIVSTSLILDLGHLVVRTREAASRVLLIAEDFDSLNRYHSSGVAGVVHRSTPASAFLDSVQKIRSGVDFVPPADGTGRPDVVGAILAKSFTSGEMKVVALLMEGMKNRVIAERLQLAEHVVRGRFKKIYDKTGFSNRLELALYISRQSAQRGHRWHPV
jgi:DNA-binding NarL/FixJ family response regulator